MSTGSIVPSNLDRFNNDLERLIAKGGQLLNAIQAETFPKEWKEELKRQFPNDRSKMDEYNRGLPSFIDDFQSWYSEAKSLVKQLLPDRLADFARHYEKPKARKELRYESYRIEDYFQGLQRTDPYTNEKIVGPDAAIPHLRQQLSILKSVKVRFESSLLDIKQIVAADLFDSELDVAAALAKNKFGRAGGAVAGVVLERHLTHVCESHSVKVNKKDPGVADLNEALKAADVIDVPTWRFIQHLADIRNLCVHNKKTDPTPLQVDDLISGVGKVVKTVF
jgi:hypothetical protein